MARKGIEGAGSMKMQEKSVHIRIDLHGSEGRTFLLGPTEDTADGVTKRTRRLGHWGFSLASEADLQQFQERPACEDGLGARLPRFGLLLCSLLTR